MLSSTSADANATVDVVLLEEVDQVFASVQNACEPSTKSAEMIDGNGECPSELSRIALKQRAAAIRGTMRPTRILVTKLVIPVVRLVATVPKVPVPAAEGGTVTLAFQSAVGGVSDDPTVTFADGTRSASFTVAEGSSAGQFAGGPSVSFGTGTTAGTLAFTVTLGSNTAQANVTIPAAVVGIDAAVAARNVACAPTLLYCTTTNVQLQINGWDNTRSTSQLVFSFFDSSGNAIAPGNITVAAASTFQQYFAGSTLA